MGQLIVSADPWQPTALALLCRGPQLHRNTTIQCTTCTASLLLAGLLNWIGYSGVLCYHYGGYHLPRSPCMHATALQHSIPILPDPSCCMRGWPPGLLLPLEHEVELEVAVFCRTEGCFSSVCTSSFTVSAVHS